MMDTVLVSVISLGVMGLFFGLVLSLADRTLAVKQDGRVKKILDVLPGINCGACGFAGCRAFAEAAVREKKLFGGCIPGGDAVNKKIGELLGIEATAKAPAKKVVVLCSAEEGSKKRSFDWRGVNSCLSAKLAGGIYDCKYGCLGLGDCVKVCPVGALKVEKGLVEVDYHKCVGCGRCVAVCPQGVLKLVDYTREGYLYWVGCNNREEAQKVRKECAEGCIGCGICTKIIKDSPFVIENNLSSLNYEKIQDSVSMNIAIEKCPAHCIKKEKVV